MKNVLPRTFLNLSDIWEICLSGRVYFNSCKNLPICPPPEEDLKVSFDFSFQSVEVTKESCNTFDGEKPIESKIEECIIKEDIQCDLN